MSLISGMFPGAAGGGASGEDDGFPDGGDPKKPIAVVEDNPADAVSPSRAISDQIPDQWAQLSGTGAIYAPPYKPESLVATVQESDTLPQLIDAMAVNISGHGIEVAPLFPATDEKGERIEPPPEAAEEKAKLLLWLETCNQEHGFQGVCNLADRDAEEIGWGCLEILRNGKGEPGGIEHLPAWQIRLGKLSPAMAVELPIRDPTTGAIVRVSRYRRFRMFVQVCYDGSVRYFKEFGDPRHVNMNTGAVRPPWEKPWHTQKVGQPRRSLEATELVYRPIYCSYSAYGVPRWVGGGPLIRAGRKAGELVIRWFDEAPIGTKAIALGGGTFRDKPTKRLLDKMDHQARGENNAWSVLGIESDATGVDAGSDTTGASRATMAVFDLGAPPPKELFEGNESLIGVSGRRTQAMFRLPLIYTGQAEDYSRAAADTARAIGEEQVIRPVREARWHRWFASNLTPALGVRWWAIRFKGAVTGDDLEAAGPVSALAAQGGASPNAMIELSNRLTGGEQHRIEDVWGDRPLAITLALIAAGADPNGPLGPITPEPGAIDPATGLPVEAAAPALGPDGKPLAGDIQATAFTGIQTESMLSILRSIAEGWLAQPAAALALEIAFQMDPAKALRLAQAVEEGSIEPPPAPVLPGGGKPGAPAGKGGGGFGGGAPGGGGKARVAAAKALEGLAIVRNLVTVLGELEERAEKEPLDPGAISPSGR